MLLDDLYTICENEIVLLAFLQYNDLLKSINIFKKCMNDCSIIIKRKKFVFMFEKFRNQYENATKKLFFLQYQLNLTQP